MNGPGLARCCGARDPPIVATPPLAQFQRYAGATPIRCRVSAIGRVQYWTAPQCVWESMGGCLADERQSDEPPSI